MILLLNKAIYLSIFSRTQIFDRTFCDKVANYCNLSRAKQLPTSVACYNYEIIEKRQKEKKRKKKKKITVMLFLAELTSKKSIITLNSEISTCLESSFFIFLTNDEAEDHAIVLHLCVQFLSDNTQWFSLFCEKRSRWITKILFFSSNFL